MSSALAKCLLFVEILDFLQVRLYLSFFHVRAWPPGEAAAPFEEQPCEVSAPSLLIAQTVLGLQPARPKKIRDGLHAQHQRVPVLANQERPR